MGSTRSRTPLQKWPPPRQHPKVSDDLVDFVDNMTNSLLYYYDMVPLLVVWTLLEHLDSIWTVCDSKNHNFPFSLYIYISLPFIPLSLMTLLSSWFQIHDVGELPGVVRWSPQTTGKVRPIRNLFYIMIRISKNKHRFFNLNSLKFFYDTREVDKHRSPQYTRTIFV